MNNFCSESLHTQFRNEFIPKFGVILPGLILNFSLILSSLWEHPCYTLIPFYFVIYLKIPKFNAISRYAVLSLGIGIKLPWIINEWILHTFSWYVTGMNFYFLQHTVLEK